MLEQRLQETELLNASLQEQLTRTLNEVEAFKAHDAESDTELQQTQFSLINTMQR